MNCKYIIAILIVLGSSSIAKDCDVCNKPLLLNEGSHIYFNNQEPIEPVKLDIIVHEECLNPENSEMGAVNLCQSCFQNIGNNKGISSHLYCNQCSSTIVQKESIPIHQEYVLDLLEQKGFSG